MTKTRWLVLAVIAAFIVAFFAFGLNRYFTLEQFQASRGAIEGFRNNQPLAAAGAFFAVYVAVTGLSLPGAAILTLAGGAVFGLFWGTLLVSFASSIGATLAFLSSRFLLHDAIQARFGDTLKPVNAGVRRDGAFYLFTLRLIPAFPFFAVNLVMGLTPIPARTFYWVSQVGMLPLTLVFVNAGTQLAKINQLKDILSPTLVASLVLIGLFPLIAKKVMEKINARRHPKA